VAKYALGYSLRTSGDKLTARGGEARSRSTKRATRQIYGDIPGNGEGYSLSGYYSNLLSGSFFRGVGGGERGLQQDPSDYRISVKENIFYVEALIASDV